MILGCTKLPTKEPIFFGNMGVGNAQFSDYFVFFTKTSHVNTFEPKKMKMKLKKFYKNIFLIFFNLKLCLFLRKIANFNFSNF